MSTTKSLGEQRVRVDFNVSGNDKVQELKIKSAELINAVEDFRKEFEASGAGSMPERHRLMTLAQTAYEEACMWAVKSVTG